VRHRIASYSQESTRYCNYAKNKFGNELTLIRPFFWNDDLEKFAIWKNTMHTIENNYNQLISLGAKPEEARSILPNSLKTEIVVTMNLREWRHFFSLRTTPKAHPQMREIAIPMLKKFQELIPIIYDDIEG
jgi:thymidylate synthase (FAD)